MPAGDVAVIDVAVSAVMVADVVPKSTAVAEARLVPVMTTLVPPAVGPLVGAIEVTVGLDTTFSVKAWVAGDSIPLVAVSVIGKLPACVGVPESTPPLNVTPLGSVPDSVMTGVGDPLAVGVNVPAAPSVKVVDDADVNAAGALPLGPGTAVHVNPFGSEPLAANVTSVFQLSTGTPLLVAHTSPASQTPVAVGPLPV